MTTKPLAFYARVSSLGRRSLEDLRSVDMQRAEATAATRALGFDVVADATFEDLDVSGATEIAERPGLSSALAAVEGGRFGGIAIAWQSRADRGGGRILEQLQARIRAANAVLVIADAPTANVFPGVEAESGYNALPQHVRAVVDRAQREDAAKKFAASRRNAIARGRKVARAPLGYRNSKDGLVIDEQAAEVVRELFRRRAAGAAIGALVRFLDKSGFAPPSRTDETLTGWAHSTVRQMLANETYLGVAEHGEFRNEEAHPAIVTRDEFDAVRIVRGDRPLGTSTVDRYLLGLARCAGCDRTLKVVRRKRVNGSYAVAYYCKGTSSGGCDARAFAKAEALEEIVESTLRDALLSDRRLIEAIEAQADVEEAARLLEAAEAELREFALRGSALDGDLFEEAIQERKGRVEMARLALAEARSRSGALPVSGGRILNAWDTFDGEERRRVTRAYFDRVVVRKARDEADEANLGGRTQVVWAGNVVAERDEVEVAA
jgi:DNA invertase Pin-like site-specific DNA recombinase